MAESLTNPATRSHRIAPSILFEFEQIIHMVRAVPTPNLTLDFPFTSTLPHFELTRA